MAFFKGICSGEKTRAHENSSCMEKVKGFFRSREAKEIDANDKSNTLRNVIVALAVLALFTALVTGFVYGGLLTIGTPAGTLSQANAFFALLGSAAAFLLATALLGVQNCLPKKQEEAVQQQSADLSEKKTV